MYVAIYVQLQGVLFIVTVYVVLATLHVDVHNHINYVVWG